MEYLLVLIGTPAAVFICDYLFFGGDFAEALVETIGAVRKSRVRTRKVVRPTSDT